MPTKQRNIRLRDALRQRSALGWHIIFLMAVYPFVSGLPSEPPPSLRLAMPIHLYDLAGGLTNAVVLVVFKFAASRSTALAGKSWFNLTAWVVSSTLGLALVFAIASTYGPLPQVYFDIAPVTITTSIAQLFTFHVFSMGFVQLRKSARELTALEAKLRAIKADLQTQVRVAREEVAARVQAALLPLLDSVREGVASMSAGGGHSTDFARQILNQIDWTVRPLSRQLIDADEEVESGSQGTTETKPSSFDVFKTAVLRPARADAFINTSFWVVFSLLLIAPAYVVLFGSIRACVAFVGTICLVSFLASRLSRPLRDRTLPAIVQVLLAVLTASAFAGLLFAVTIFADATISSDEYGGLAQYVATGEFATLLIASLHSLTLAGSWSALAARRVATLDLKKLILRLQVERSLQARRMAHLVHGRVQATLQAIAFRFSGGKELDEATRLEVGRQLELVVAELNVESEATTDLMPGLEQLRQLWDGICDISIEVDGDVVQKLAKNPQSANSALVIIEEAVTNAFKHGRAEAARVQIAFAGELQLAIRVSHRGLDSAKLLNGATSANLEAGFGSATYDALTDSWSLKVDADDTIFEALIALDA